MKKIFFTFFVMLITFTACKNSANINVDKNTENTIVESSKEVVVEDTTLPKYHYNGKAKYMDIVCREIENYSKIYDNDNLLIPSPIILYYDDTNQDDIKIFGHFNLYFYSLKDNDTLLIEAGGHDIGCMHFSKNVFDYELIKYDMINDENDFENRLKELTAGYPDLYDKFIQNEDMDLAQNYYISDYVNTNKLYNIKYYQYFGQEKKLLINLKNEATSKNDFLGTFTMDNEANMIVINNENVMLTLEDVSVINFENYQYDNNTIYVSMTNGDEFLYAHIIKHNNNIVFVVDLSNIENMNIGKTLTFYNNKEIYE